MKIPALVLAVTVSSAAFAEPDETPAIDKAGYTLFDPTPDSAQRDMDIDRPDTTDGPRTIDAGHLQIEGGLSDYSYDNDRFGARSTRLQSWSYGQINLRLGIVNEAEINMIVTPYVAATEIDTGPHGERSIERAAGFGDLSVGGTFNFWGNDTGDTVWATALAVKPILTLPTAPGFLGTGHASLAVEFPFLVNLPGGFGLGLQTTATVERNAPNSGYVAGYQASFALNHELMIDALDGYVEYSAHGTAERHQQPDQSLDFGLVYALSIHTRLDTGVNLGLTRSATDIEWLTGFSVLF